MSCRRTGLWLLLGACALACAAEERDFGGSDAAVKADDDEHSSAGHSDSSAAKSDAAASHDGGAAVGTDTEPATDSEPDEDTEPVRDETAETEDTDEDEDTGESPVTESSEPEPSPVDAATEAPTATDTDEADAGNTPACTKDEHCGDLNPCNGEESCVEGVCELGTWAGNGEQCELGDDAAQRVCSNGNCVLSTCGDGYADDRRAEDCDDANTNNSDGCTVACEYSCTDDDQCDDTLFCNGKEICDSESHMCVEGEWADDQEPCGDEQLCHYGECVPAGCGNGEVEAEVEVCDDGNLDDGDGCDADCTPTCVEDAECDDGSVCTGQEKCDRELHVCLPGEALDCQAADACHSGECDPLTGCFYPLIDADWDGQASSEFECGTDCNDSDETIHSGAAELCDDKDNNCNGSTDETAPMWYPDCDGDGYAPVNAAGTQQCASPQPPAECAGRGLVGAWTVTPPASGNEDCWDDSASVHPMNATENDAAWNQYSIEGRPVSVDYDYNCDEDEEKRYVTQATSCHEPYVFEPAFAAAAIGGPILQLPCYGDGWTGAAIPACNDTAAWKDCARVNGECAWVATTMHQSCR